MTREEAIRHLNTYSTTNGSGQTSQAQHEEAKRIGIKALEQEPCEDWHDIPSNEMNLEQARQAVRDLRKFVMDNHILPKLQSCKDAISRQAVIDALCDGCELFKNGEQTCFTKCEEYHFLATLPPVTPQPKTGHWIRMKAYEKWGCSECSTVFRFTFKEHNYCPNCGAKMEAEE